ncbi:MAG: C40 family peptidase [Bacteroidota bacterium]
MRYKPTLVLFFLVLSSCIVKKKTTYGTDRTVTVEQGTEAQTAKPPKKEKKRKNRKADNIVASAMRYTGTRYRFGGTTKKGMDCSGLVYVSLKENAIPFPRVSYQMAGKGQRVRLKEVRKGDLLFFKTSKSGKRINHVGLVVQVKGDQVKFIHATSSRGVIVSSLKEGFWNKAFVKATRIL